MLVENNKEFFENKCIEHLLFILILCPCFRINWFSLKKVVINRETSRSWFNYFISGSLDQIKAKKQHNLFDQINRVSPQHVVPSKGCCQLQIYQKLFHILLKHILLAHILLISHEHECSIFITIHLYKKDVLSLIYNKLICSK